MKLTVGYPSAAEEEGLLRLRHSGVAPSTLDDVAHRRCRRLQRPSGGGRRRDGQRRHRGVRRRPGPPHPRLPSVSLGASPRAGVHLLAASKAWARISGRGYVLPDDVVSLVPAVLRHRLLLTPEAELDLFTPEQALRTVLSTVPVPR